MPRECKTGELRFPSFEIHGRAVGDGAIVDIAWELGIAGGDLGIE
jgi:hypothetical protein